jgi:DNA polymerase-3 subunit epsilon
MKGPVFSHTTYDRFAITRACAVYGYAFCDAVWLDSAQVVRRAWPDKFGKSGYGLNNVAAYFGITLNHHDAGEDARAVAEIVIRASHEYTGDVADLAKRVGSPVAQHSSANPDLRRSGNVVGPLHGEVVAFTGEFEVSKSQQADLAAFAGCEVGNSVTKKTTLVVVGNNTFARGERSGKSRKAEQMARVGLRIRIISEADFRRLITE